MSRRTGNITKKLAFHWNIHHIDWILLLAAVVFAVLILTISIPLNRNRIDSEKNELFIEDWQCSRDDGAFQRVLLPCIEDAPIVSHLNLRNQLPDELAKGATVLLRTSQQNAEVFVDDVKIYSSFGEESTPYMSSSAYHFVRLPTDGAGKTIKIVLTSPYERYAGYMNQIYLGSKASHIFFLFRENGFHFMIGFLIFSIGLLTVMMLLFTKREKRKVSLIYLGAFFTCAGFWLMAESHMMQFIFPYPMAVTNSSIFALSLLPVFLGLYYYNTQEHAFHFLVKYMVFGMIISCFVFAIFSCAAPELPLLILPFYLIFMGIFVTALFLTLLVENIRVRNLFSLSVCGGFVFGFFCLLELFFYLSSLENYRKSFLLTVGLLIFCLLMIADAIRDFTRIHLEAVKVSALTVLAYTDSLTGLKNRTAFLEKLTELNIEEDCGITIGMFDINNLKQVNDTLGHLTGDAMMRHCVKAIKESLKHEVELYRIGGDEFATIITHDQALDLQTLEDQLTTVMEQENKKPLSYDLSVACGYATFSKDDDKNLLDTLKRADEKMYLCKRIQKDVQFQTQGRLN